MVNLTILSTVVVPNEDGSYMEVHLDDDDGKGGSAGTVAIVLVIALIVAIIICRYFCHKMKMQSDEHYQRQRQRDATMAK